ncbi:MAG: OmpA family protein [Bacteroidetes bacterium]|jgi:outer membrane protein OmpA-like peptidoglycan-associated protein|nr:OmpA family protein [Bacteroidota bacterium]
MKHTSHGFFWPSFTDLMTSLFFVMLVLYVLTVLKLNTTIKLQKEKLSIIEAVEENLKPLKTDTLLFAYEGAYKRFKLAFDVKFNKDKYDIDQDDHLLYPEETRQKIVDAGNKLKTVVDRLKKAKESDSKLKNVSYIIVISGYASKDNTDRNHNYELSYKRALTLWSYWKENYIDFESPKYKDLIDLHIAGNGWGGVGRLPAAMEENNQRFLIQIFPKIGDIK